MFRALHPHRLNGSSPQSRCSGVNLLTYYASESLYFGQDPIRWSLHVHSFLDSTLSLVDL